MSRHVDPEIESSARQSPIADPDTYDRPASPRISGGNLSLSLAVWVVAGLLAVGLLLAAWWWL